MSTGALGDMGSPLTAGRTERVQEERTTAEVVAGGSVAEAIGGAGAVVLSIIGLAAVYPGFMASICAIVLGAALVLRGFAITTRYYSLLEASGANQFETAELGSGIGAEVLGGTAAIVLGILALLDLDPLVLVPVAAIVLGATLLLGCGSNARLNDMAVERWQATHTGSSRRVVGDILSLTNGAQALVGVGVVVLGIVGLVNHYHLTLSLVAFLCAGASVLLSGGTVTGKMMSMLSRSSNRNRFSHAV